MTSIKISDIVSNNLCTGCGACVSECSSIKGMKWNEEGFLVPDLDPNKGERSEAVNFCPFNPNPSTEVKDEDVLADEFITDVSNYDTRIGKFENTYVGYSKEFRNTSSSGGIATYIFEKLLALKYVDYLFVVTEVNGSYEYKFFNAEKSIIEISKTRYIPVTMDELFKKIFELKGTVAVSGVACFVKAVRLKQHYYPELKNKIRFIIGIICGGLKSKSFTEYLSSSAGIHGTFQKQDYRVKDANLSSLDYSFGAFNESGEFQKVRMQTLGDMWGSGLFKANACDFCDDVTTELADISLGDAWIDPYKKDGLGNSIIITRSVFAENLILEGISSGDLNIDVVNKDKIIRSQDASFRHRQGGIYVRILQNEKLSKLYPKKRERFFKKAPFEFRLVQLERRKIRQLSLDFWNMTKESNLFEKKLKVHRDKLKTLSKFFHRVQKLKKILGIKTL